MVPVRGRQPLNPAKFIAEKLQVTALPTLVRPLVPSEDDPPQELIHWGIRKYAYSLISHIRMVLKGIVLLSEAGNTPTCIIACRHVYEWNMQSAYAYVAFRSFLSNQDLKGAWDLYLTICGAMAGLRGMGKSTRQAFNKMMRLKILYISENIRRHTRNTDWKLLGPRT
jgi:hypothetical protein